jgi:hypothetical protein
MSESDEALPPGPWDIIPRDQDCCLEVRAPTGEHVYIYYENTPERRAVLRRFSRDQAEQLARAIANLAGLGVSERNV